jgi:hypothetical protein
MVHLRKDLIPSNQVVMTISVSGEWAEHENAVIDPKTSGCFWLYQTLAKAKYDFASTLPLFCGGLNAFAAALPSVIVPIWNVVLYPQGTGFWKHVELENVEPFTFDARLFPENIPVEPLEPEPSAN